MLSDLVIAGGERVAGLLRTASAKRRCRHGGDLSVFGSGRIVNRVDNRDAVTIGQHARLRGEVFRFPHAGRIQIGDWFYLGPGSSIWSSDPEGITIGDRVLVSANVMIHDTNSHPLDAASRFEQTKAIFLNGHPSDIATIRSAPIRIGNDVWIGLGARVLKGVSIGDRAIVGAGATVLADVESDTKIPPGIVHRGAQGND
ncbi:MAG: acyltransferase [Croceibacterium sp.]